MTDQPTLEKRGYTVDFTHDSIVTTSLYEPYRKAVELQLKAGTVGLTRRELSRTEVPPTQAEIDEYNRLRKLLDEVEASPLWENGYEGGYLREPSPTVQIIWDETMEEFEARVNEAFVAFMRDPSIIFDGIPRRTTIPATFRREETR